MSSKRNLAVWCPSLHRAFLRCWSVAVQPSMAPATQRVAQRFRARWLMLGLPFLVTVLATPGRAQERGEEQLRAAVQEEADRPLAGRSLVPLPSVPDYTGGQGWGFALGVGVELEGAYDGSDEWEVELDPAGAIQYSFGAASQVFFEGIELGYRVRLQDRWLAQVGARYEGGREADDSEDGRLDGLDEVDDTIVGFAELRYALDEAWRSWVGARIQQGNSDFGTLGILGAGYSLEDRQDGFGTELIALTSFGSADFFARDFGVSAAESARSNLPAYAPGGGYRSVSLQAIHRRHLWKGLELQLSAGFEWYGAKVRRSAVARRDYEVEVGLRLVYRF